MAARIDLAYRWLNAAVHARVWSIAALTGAAMLFLFQHVHADELKTLAGGVLEGKLVRFEPETLTFKSKEGEEKVVPLAEVLSVDFGPRKPSDEPRGKVFHQLRLVDGSRIAAEELRFEAEQLWLRWGGANEEISLPLASVATLVMDAQDVANGAALEAVLARAPKADVIRLLGRDGKSVNEFEGVVGAAEDDGKTIRFVPAGGDAVQLAVSRLRAIAFVRPEASAPRALGTVIDQRGNRLAFAKLKYGENETQVTTPLGLNFRLPTAAVQRLDLSAGKLTYLSDLEPLRVETEFLVFVPPADRRYGRDETLFGEPLSVGRKRYAKGIATHARTLLDYDVAGYNFFRCVLGLDDAVRRVGHAEVRIEGDGRELFRQIVTRQDSKPYDVDLKITGVKRLRLIVDFGADHDLGDHVNFADARVMK